MTTNPAEKERKGTRALSLGGFGARPLARIGHWLGLEGFGRKCPPLFLLAFAVCVVATIVVHARFEFWPGQDDHYDKYSASVVARWGSDPAITKLYEPIKPWHAQTFLYVVAGMLGKLIDPTLAFRIVYVGLYFIGLPVATLYILIKEERSPWGSLLAFPLAYTKMWVYGYLKFVLAGPFFLLSIFGFARFFYKPKLEVRTVVLYGVAMLLTSFNHAHVFGMTAIVVALFWLFALFAHVFWSFGAPPPNRSLKDFWKRTSLAAAASVPALLAFYSWYRDTQAKLASIAPPAGGPGLRALFLGALDTKFRSTFIMLVTLKNDHEYEFVIVTLAVILGGMVLRWYQGKDRSPVPELFLAVCFLSQYVVPHESSGQVIAPRHMDFVCWLAPICATSALFSRHRIASIVGVGAIGFYTYARLGSIFDSLAKYNREETRGLAEVAKAAPKGHFRITQVTFGPGESKYWYSYSFHQQYAYVAAKRGYEAPVYDTRTRAMEVMYRDAPPSPPTILVNEDRWFDRPTIWNDFDLVLTFRWHPAAAVRAAVNEKATVVAKSGEWEIWRKK